MEKRKDGIWEMEERISKNYHFKPQVYKELEKWEQKAEKLKWQIQVTSGIFPELPKIPIKPVITGRQVYRGVVIENVYFESMPGVFVAGNLYYQKEHCTIMPAILNPHGHWDKDRFERTEIVDVPARCMNQARNGMVAFTYDMIGRGESLQFPHGFRNRNFEEYGISLLGMQLYNSIRCLDFLESLPFVDSSRIGCTGASGGGTQTFLLTAVDDRIKAAAPVNMVSFHMQGGCECENAPGLRIGTNNVELAALAAPRPLMITGCTGDWTCNVPEEEYPALREIYELYGESNKVEYYYSDAPHNYRKDVREKVCEWFLEQFFGKGRKYLPEEDFQIAIESLKVYSKENVPESQMNLEQFTNSIKKEKQGVCKKMIAEKSGREQLKKALQILFGIENQDKSTKDFQAFEKERKCILSVGKKREDIPIMKNSGIEKETDIIHLHCSYGNHQFYFEQENAYVFYKSETAKIIQQIIQEAEKIKKNGYQYVMLCSDEVFIWECCIAYALSSQIDGYLSDGKKLEECRGKNFYQPGFEGIGGIKTIEILMQEKCS